ncbi:Flp family type IVb pilin [Pseudomonas yamanorum]|nr:Flp family type IVb pilin [Pseudomonas yamanorum]
MFLNLVMKLCIHAQLFFRRKDGATAIEYVILVAIVALVIVTAGQGLGGKISNVFTSISNALT